jgi:hypothetical protein
MRLAYEVAVRQSYRVAVSPEEFEAKFNDVACERIAYYMKGLGTEIEYFDDTSEEKPNSTVQLLFDFLAFVDVDAVAMKEFLGR